MTESFLVQLDVDLEALGERIPKLKMAFPRSGDSVRPPRRCRFAGNVRTENADLVL